MIILSISRSLIISSIVLLGFFPGFALAQVEGSLSPLTSLEKEVLTSQGVNEMKDLRCEAIDETLLHSIGELVLRGNTDSNDEAWNAIRKGMPSEKQQEIFKGAALAHLGCIQSDYDKAASGMMMLEQGKGKEMRTPPFSQKTTINQTTFGFVAAWTTLVWLFSVMGFGVFMVWVTSSKFRFQFRRMAEGDLEVEGKALDILKERYARGEITKEQFDKMRKDVVY